MLNIALKEILITHPIFTRRLTSLQPESSYKCRVQAVNSVGSGPWSGPIRINTRPRPPSPPSLECIVRTHNSLKLRWGEGRSNALLLYKLEMENKAGSVANVGNQSKIRFIMRADSLLIYRKPSSLNLPLHALYNFHSIETTLFSIAERW